MSKPRFEVYEDAAGEWRWRLRSGNGEIVAQGESHTRESHAMFAAQTVIAITKQMVEPIERVTAESPAGGSESDETGPDAQEQPPAPETPTEGET